MCASLGVVAPSALSSCRRTPASPHGTPQPHNHSHTPATPQPRFRGITAKSQTTTTHDHSHTITATITATPQPRHSHTIATITATITTASQPQWQPHTPRRYAPASRDDGGCAAMLKAGGGVSPGGQSGWRPEARGPRPEARGPRLGVVPRGASLRSDATASLPCWRIPRGLAKEVEPSARPDTSTTYHLYLGAQPPAAHRQQAVQLQPRLVRV